MPQAISSTVHEASTSLSPPGASGSGRMQTNLKQERSDGSEYLS